jgi:hypothetical protein
MFTDWVSWLCLESRLQWTTDRNERSLEVFAGWMWCSHCHSDTAGICCFRGDTCMNYCSLIVVTTRTQGINSLSKTTNTQVSLCQWWFVFAYFQVVVISVRLWVCQWLMISLNILGSLQGLLKVVPPGTCMCVLAGKRLWCALSRWSSGLLSCLEVPAMHLSSYQAWPFGRLLFCTWPLHSKMISQSCSYKHVSYHWRVT